MSYIVYTEVKLESCFNRSIKIMMDLPFSTHRGLIEPLSERKHIRKTFASRFLGMIEKIRKSKKQILTTILSEIEHDARSTTGKNLRLLMLECGRSDISEVQQSDIDTLPYFQLADDEEWRTEMIKHLLEERQQHPLDNEDLEWLEFLCCD